MGVSVSKPGKTDPLHLCKERTECIKQAIDSRYALSAAHLFYIQSLRNIGSALRQFVEFRVPVEQSVANLDSERAPSPSSFASQSPPRMAEGRPLSPLICHDAIHRAGSSMADLLEEQKSLAVQISSSWDFFNPNDPEVCEKFQNRASRKFTKLVNWSQFNDSDVIPLIEEQLLKSYRRNEELIDAIVLDENIEFSSCLPNSQLSNARESVEELHGSKMEKLYLFRRLYAEREDASEFITHRAKDLLSSMKDIELRFLRAADAGADISKMLETRKIWPSISTGMIDRAVNELISSRAEVGKWPTSRFLSILLLACCKEENLLHLKHLRPAAKVITWNRSVSSLSSSSSCKRRLVLEHTFENGDGGSDFRDEFCMISGSHSCTLERLCAWEKKLFDEVKASETIRREYNNKCRLLRHQYVRGSSVDTIDKTRAAVKDLHSQLRVSIQAVDFISKKIEKMRDAELQPQLLELIHGLLRMWKVMLECHHAQFITISLAYHVKTSTVALDNESYRQTLAHFHDKLNCHHSSFVSWIKAHKSYLQALNMWLQNCILLPEEQRPKYRKAAALPSRLPPIFVLCQNWLSGINSLASEELGDAIGSVISVNESKGKEKENKLERVGREEKKCEEDASFSSLQTSLKRWFDQLSKVSEAAVKVFEDVKKSNDAACLEYTRCGSSV